MRRDSPLLLTFSKKFYGPISSGKPPDSKNRGHPPNTDEITNSLSASSPIVLANLRAGSIPQATSVFDQSATTSSQDDALRDLPFEQTPRQRQSPRRRSNLPLASGEDQYATLGIRFRGTWWPGLSAATDPGFVPEPAGRSNPSANPTEATHAVQTGGPRELPDCASR